MKANRKGMASPEFRNRWQARAIEMWRTAAAKRDGEAPAGTQFESIEEYLARGGKITRCEPGSADYALYLQRPFIGGMNGKRA